MERSQTKAKKKTTRTARARPGFRMPKAAEVLADHFRRRIIRGELKEGDRLPKEQMLIDRYGVSRSTFREAFLLLESEGLISVSRGARTGALVHRPNVKAAARQMNFIMQAHNVTLDDIYRSLAIIEPAVVRSLAERTTKADISVLRALIAKTYKSIDDDHVYAENAAEFHRVLVERAGLLSFALIMDLLTSLVGGYFESASEMLPRKEAHANKMAVMKTKEKLVDLLEKHDPDAAEALWRKHFETIREHMLRWQPSKAVEDIFFT